VAFAFPLSANACRRANPPGQPAFSGTVARHRGHAPGQPGKSEATCSMSRMFTGPATFLPPDVIANNVTCRTRVPRPLPGCTPFFFPIDCPRAIRGGSDTSFEGTMIIPYVSHVIRQRWGISNPGDQAWP